MQVVYVGMLPSSLIVYLRLRKRKEKITAHDNNNTNIYWKNFNLFRMKVERNPMKSMTFPVFNTFLYTFYAQNSKPLVLNTWTSRVSRSLLLGGQTRCHTRARCLRWGRGSSRSGWRSPRRGAWSSPACLATRCWHRRCLSTGSLGILTLLALFPGGAGTIRKKYNKLFFPPCESENERNRLIENNLSQIVSFMCSTCS